MKRLASQGLALARDAVRSMFLLPVLAYQLLISPVLPARCKYHPTCSEYAAQAVRELGVVRGGVVAAWRLARCNPWSHGGVDELADRTLFRDRARNPASTHAPHAR